jgi:hypothetical protein
MSLRVILVSPMFVTPFQIDILRQTSVSNSETKDGSLATYSPVDGVHDFINTDALLPALCRNGCNLQKPSPSLEYLDQELDVTRLTRYYDYLWLAGRPIPPRSLTYQKAAGREITISEQMDMHLLWEPGKIFIKPIPRYLLSTHFWDAFLVCKSSDNCVCFQGRQLKQETWTDEFDQHNRNKSQPSLTCARFALFQTALGFLLSYAALIPYESDFQLAQKEYLLPSTVRWADWRLFSQQLIEHSSKSFGKRFRFGELRLGRLNSIYRLLCLDIRGYHIEYQTYPQSVRAYLRPIVTYTFIIGLILAAMQVGHATKQLKDSDLFHDISYGLTIFSFTSFLALLVAISSMLSVFFTYNLISTLRFLRVRLAYYEKLETTC